MKVHISKPKIPRGQNFFVFFILFIFIAITVVEYIFVYTSVGYGIVLALFVTILIYVVVSIPEYETDAMKSAESLALIPLYILFTSSLPWFFINQEYLLPAVYSIILALCFWHIIQKDIKMERIGFVKKKWVKYLLLGSLIGIPTGTIEYFVLVPPPAFPSFQAIYLMRDFTYMLLFVGLGEEMLFRGIIQTDLQKTFGERNGLLAASYLFGIMHMSWRSPIELVFATVAGYILGYLYNKTGNNLVAPIFMHGINNTMLVGIWPYLF